MVYTTSLTIYAQQMTRLLDRLPLPGPDVTRTSSQKSGAVLAVYEKPDPNIPLEQWTTDRSDIYSTCTALAEAMDWPAAQCGPSVRKPELAAALSTADAVVFVGHCEDDAPSIMGQGILLGPTLTPATTSNEAAGSEGVPRDRPQPGASTSNNAPPEGGSPDDLFTVANMFGVKGKMARHVTLVACGTASQAIAQGDEPLGLVTALQCAGAASVAGTMWPIDTLAGRVYTDIFFKEVRKGRDAGGVVDLGVALQATVQGMREPSEVMRVPSETMSPYYWAGFVLHGAWYL